MASWRIPADGPTAVRISTASIIPQKLAALISGCESADVGETLFSSSYTPDPRSALDVLAFVLTPVEAFAPIDNDEEREAVAELLGSAKQEAVKRWFSLRNESAGN